MRNRFVALVAGVTILGGCGRQSRSPAAPTPPPSPTLFGDLTSRATTPATLADCLAGRVDHNCVSATAAGIHAGAEVVAAPTGLTATVVGNTVTLSWTAPPGPIFGSIVEAGAVPGSGNLAAIDFRGTATSYTATGVAA